MQNTPFVPSLEHNLIRRCDVRAGGHVFVLFSVSVSLQQRGPVSVMENMRERSPNQSPLHPSPSTSHSSLLDLLSLSIWPRASSTRVLQVFMDMTPVYGLIFLFKWTQVNPLSSLSSPFLHLSPSLYLLLLSLPPSLLPPPPSPILNHSPLASPHHPQLLHLYTSFAAPHHVPHHSPHNPLSPNASHTFDPRPDWNSPTAPRPKS
jgi:hypothetical protein